jgi:hypothetical protein
MSDAIRRPDTGTRKNMIMEMAASILHDKIEERQMILDQQVDNGKIEAGSDRWKYFNSTLVAMRDAIAMIDDNAGCW